jgi:hypothetical protein
VGLELSEGSGDRGSWCQKLGKLGRFSSESLRVRLELQSDCFIKVIIEF